MQNRENFILTNFKKRNKFTNYSFTYGKTKNVLTFVKFFVLPYVNDKVVEYGKRLMNFVESGFRERNESGFRSSIGDTKYIQIQRFCLKN